MLLCGAESWGGFGLPGGRVMRVFLYFCENVPMYQANLTRMY
jgi:hypothetical protein